MILGASRGLGLALAGAFSDRAGRAWLVSRTEPALQRAGHVEWLSCDLSVDQDFSALKEAVGDEPIDLLIHNAGIWETVGLDRIDHDTIASVMQVNLTSLLQICRALHSNIVLGQGNIVLIGSTCGLENEGSEIVAYTASKFGLRGAAHALREHFRKHLVRVTCINPGSMATEIGLGRSGEALAKHENRRMPVDDVVSLIDCISNLSIATCVKEIDLPATLDDDV